MLRSKFQYKELKINIRNVIKSSGRNIRKDGSCQIYTEVVGFYSDGSKKTRLIPTGVQVKHQNFKVDGNAGKIDKNEPDSFAKEIKAWDAFGEVVDQLTQREKGTWNDDFNPNKLIDLSDMFPKSNKTLLDFIDDYISKRKGDGDPSGTVKEFTSLKNRMKGYEDAKKQKLKFEDINLTFADNFNSYLSNALIKKKDGSSKHYNKGTINKTFVILKTVLNFYYNRQDELGIRISDRFRLKEFMHGKASGNDPNPLTEIQLSTLRNHTFEFDGQNKIKDRFLWQCSTGMRFSDAFNITKANIKNDRSIYYYPQKTVRKQDNLVKVPINDLSRQILEKYDYNLTELKITNQDYNRDLATMFSILITKYPDVFTNRFTSHAGRDTFITHSIIGGIDVPTLMSMVGQTTWNVMRKYFKPSEDEAFKKMQQIEVFKL